MSVLSVDAWRSASEEALRGSGPKLIHREMGITTRVIRDLFSEDVSQVYVDEEEDHREILSYIGALSPDLCRRVVPKLESVAISGAEHQAACHFRDEVAAGGTP